MRTHPQKPTSRHTLTRRPDKPALGNGRIQVAARRTLWMLETATTSEIIDHAYCRRLLILGERRRNDFNRAVRRALRASARSVGRAPSRGRPWMWRLAERLPPPIKIVGEMDASA
jgi:hypothetical protein